MAAEEKNPRNHADSQDRNVVVPLAAARSSLSISAIEEEVLSGDRHASAASAKAIWTATKLLSGGLLLAWLIAWPVGSTLVHKATTGTFAIKLGYSPEVFLFAITSAALILGAGYAVSAGARLEAAAQRLQKSFSRSDEGTAFPQGNAARAQISALNAEIDTALSRLAEAESLIRQQVRAIDSASSAIESGAVKSTERLERERKALMDLTEEMNKEADRFAEKIAERSSASNGAQEDIEKRILEKEQELSSQLQRLEAVSAKSLDRYEQLASAMEGRSENLANVSAEATERQSAIANQIDENAKRISTVQAELAEQSARLEDLIKDQRRRADRLAKVVTEQAGRLTQPARPEPVTPVVANETPVGASRRRLAWKDILATVEGALPGTQDHQTEDQSAAVAEPEEPHRVQDIKEPQDASVMMDRLISRIHNFSLVMYTQLFSEPTHDQLDRFENGERQLFARSLIKGDTEDLKGLIAEEVARNNVFKQRVLEYLRDFDRLLEPLSSDQDGEAAIESYLSSPIGRLYVLTGTAVGHFA